MYFHTTANPSHVIEYKIILWLGCISYWIDLNFWRFLFLCHLHHLTKAQPFLSLDIISCRKTTPSAFCDTSQYQSMWKGNVFGRHEKKILLRCKHIKNRDNENKSNKTGLQPVSKPVEQEERFLRLLVSL